MKKLLTIAVCSAAFVAMADIPSPMPNNTFKIAIRQAVAEAKAYTDAKIAGGGGGSGVSSNEVVAIINAKLADVPSAADVAAIAETAGAAKGTATANSESIAALTTTVAGKLDTEVDPSVPAWSKASDKPSYDASEITYQNGYVGAYLAELNGKIPSVPAWALASSKPSYTASEIGFGNGTVESQFDELSAAVGSKANSNDVYSKNDADSKFLTQHQSLDYYAKKEHVYSKSDVDGKLDPLEFKLREALARIKVLEKSSVPAEGVVGVVAQPGEPVVVNDSTKDAVIGGTIDTGAVALTAKSVDIDNLDAAPQYGANDAGITVTSPTISVSDSSLKGATQLSSNLVEAHDVDTMTIKGTTFSGQTYNTIMSGQRTTDYLKELTIEDCNFAEDCAHVNVWFAGFKDDAVLNIKNCTFKTCEQFLCVSDFSGADKKLTINLENVEILNYEKGTTEAPDAYEGILLFDDRICADDATFVATAPFKNVTLNLKNCTAGGVALTADTFKMGTGAPGQMFYLYCAKARKVYTFDATTKAIWPKVVVNDVVINDPAN